MPEMDGVALAREIRRHRDERELPLLLLTSLGRLPQARSAAEFAAQLAKPVKASQLYNALVQTARRARARTRGRRDEPDGGKPATSSLRILLAEDNAVNQKVALRLLDRLGYRADVAGNGLEALEALERQPYDVVLMDVQMPELDGLDASRRICERWPAEARPRIIAMTANAHARGPRGVLRRRDGRLRREADPSGGAGGGAGPRPTAHGHPARRARSALARPRRRRTREPEGARRGRLPRGGDRHVPRDAPALLATLRTSVDDEGDTASFGGRRTRSSRTARPSGAGTFAELCRDARAASEGAASSEVHPSSSIESSESTPSLEKALAALRSTAARERFRSPPGTILIADDNRMNRLLLGRGLEQQGHTVVFAETRARGARPAASPALRPDAARRPDARARRLPGPRGAEARPASPRHPGDHDVLARRARQRGQVRRDGCRGLPDQADQPGTCSTRGSTRASRRSAFATSSAS